MSTKSDPLATKWKARAWTPERCAVWKAFPDRSEQQRAFEAWVNAEPPFCYPEHISAEWLAAAEAAKASAHQ